MLVIRASEIIAEFWIVKNPYTFKTDDEVPKKFDNVAQVGMYARYTKAMKNIAYKEPDKL